MIFTISKIHCEAVMKNILNAQLLKFTLQIRGVLHVHYW
jgi:hypothetical protein